MNYLLKQKSENFHVFIWLLLLTIMSFLMIFIGGLTRLTDSGLSMVNWQPIMGILPPLNNNNWLKVFNAYKESPEFIIVNSSMNLSEFKYIFWWEWFHRFFARCIGIIFIVPMFFFIIKRRISKTLLKNLIFLLSLGIFQAIIGWWMVKSGLSENPYVSQYRLAFHLTNAVLILSILFWLTLNAWSNINIKFKPKNNIEIFILVLFFLLLLTIISGAFMAGTNAGQSFNTYPLMNGQFIPEGYFLIDNSIRNFFENTIAINFNHRWLATVTFVLIISFTLYLYAINEFKNQKIAFILIMFFSFLQFFLGILTLLTNVKIYFASLHQINSMFLLIAILYTYHSIKKKLKYNV